MKFCNICGKIMKIEIDEKKVKCSCGYIENLSEVHELSFEEKSKKKEEKGVGVGNEKNMLASFPHECKKCGYDKAQVIELGIWFSDEAGVIRYRCGKCGFTEQDKDSNT